MSKTQDALPPPKSKAGELYREWITEMGYAKPERLEQLRVDIDRLTDIVQQVVAVIGGKVRVDESDDA